MNLKFFEVRDRCTFIPIMALAIDLNEPLKVDEKYILRRAGFSPIQRCIQVVHFGLGLSKYDAYDWPHSSRTMTVAHDYIEKSWDDLVSGEVIDVEFILGEKPFKKLSEGLESK